MAMALLLSAAACADAQVVAAQPGIQAVPAPGLPPPVRTGPLTSEAPLGQTSRDRMIAPSSNTDQPAPVDAPGIPALPGALPPDRSAVTIARPAAGPAAPASANAGGPVGPRSIGSRAPDMAAGGLDLVSAYDLGERRDATYRAALAEHDANRQVANQTIAGYLPSASYNYQNIPTETGSRHVVSVTQPIVSLSGLATLRQRGPRRRYADATLAVRAQDLANRLMVAVADIIKASEASKLNDARIDALAIQSDRASRLYDRGLGTITDARDIEVRYEQALANRVLLRSEQIAAQARLNAIIGIAAPEQAFALPAQLGPIELAPVDMLLAQQETDNPAIAAARENEHISKLEADRIRGSFVPTLGASATYSRAGGASNSFVGISVNAPLNGGTLFQAGAARATARRSFEERRQAEERARTELSRLHALVDGGRQALGINAKAIAAAKLSVEANSRSYEGGVRTSVDVVNAIQTQFEVQSNYVQSAATLATNYLNLLLLAGEDPAEAFVAVQAFLLGR